MPWLSVLDGQTATVKITSTITAAAASDTTIKVTFKPSHNRIKINGLDELQNISLSTLQTMNSIQITATEWDTAKIKSYSKEGIWVISNGGDTIGKLSISCQKPLQKRVAFIYVNSGNGYRRTISKDSLLEQLNSRSHNQIFKHYTLRNDIPDTLDVTTQYAADSINANAEIQVWLNIKYRQKHFPAMFTIGDLNRINDTSMYLANEPGRCYMYYITDINISTNTLGETRPSSSISTVVLCGLANTRYRIMETTSHEMGHALGLEHTFFDPLAPPTLFCPHIPIYSSINFMDYGREGLDPEKDCFYYYQWLYSKYY